jgi:pimeloyl-ACP methyl ester carboxylesterase
MPFFIQGDTSIYYEQRGRGYPLLLLPPGGLMATIAWWGRTAFNAPEIFPQDYLTVAIDERNAGQSFGPLDTDDPWGSYARDHIALMNHLGIERFHVLGSCIGCSHALKLIELAPERVASAVLVQPTGIDEKSQELLHGSRHGWVEEVIRKYPQLDRAKADAFGKKVWTGEFVISVTREFVKRCKTPLLVLPGIDIGHPNAIGREVAALAPNSSVIEPWKEPLDIVPATIRKIREFLRQHTPTEGRAR